MRSNSAPVNPLRVEGSAPGAPAPGGRLRAYLKLALGLALLALFLTAATRFSAQVPALVTMADRIETYDLRPAAIYYTDHKAAAEGEAYIHDSLAYPPRKP
ncbi:MAG: hypothetical protein HZB87_08010 [Desulfatitalea sp.]|nr:hypothetical protein [Desulfatitalea sp.]MBI5895041.1 hypothetical protein [Desulfobacterales bacterium]